MDAASTTTSQSDINITIDELIVLKDNAKLDEDSKKVAYYASIINNFLIARQSDGIEPKYNKFDIINNAPLKEGTIERMQREFKDNEIERNRQAALDFTFAKENIVHTEFGYSERLIRRYGKDMRYSYVFNNWLLWNGKFWEWDRACLVNEKAKETIRRVYLEIAEMESASKQDDAMKFAIKVQTSGKVDGIVKLSRSDPKIVILPEQMDVNKNVLNFTNGTLNIKTFEFQDHRKDDYCTKVMGSDYDENAVCPTWNNHLDMVFDGNKDFIHNFQLMCGYSLQHGNPEQLMFILYGQGQTGKSVTVGRIADAMGTYANTMAPETIMEHKFTNANAPRDDLLQLLNMRVTTCTEGDQKSKLNEGLVKRLTGDDKLNVRGLYGKPVSFFVTSKIWFATNNLPSVRETGNAIWRRLWPIPFTVYIPEEKRDKDIKEKLTAELPGIINWMVDGLKEYEINLHRQLTKPGIVVDALNKYKNRSDVLLPFLSTLKVDQTNLSLTISKKNLYDLYTEYCEINGDEPFHKNTIGKMMGERGFQEGVNSEGTLRLWKGIGYKTQSQKDSSGFVNVSYKR